MSCSYTIRSLQRPSKARSALHADIIVQVLDPTRRLSQDLAVSSGDWILIEHNGRQAVAQVILDPDPDGDDDEDILVSPLLLFFLRDIPGNPFLDRRGPIQVDIRRFNEKAAPYQAPVPAAESVVLRPVSCHRSQPCREAIQAFFRVPHCFTSEMIIGIPLDPNHPALYNDLHLCGLPSQPSPFDALPDLSVPDSVALYFYQISCPDQSFFTVEEAITRVTIESTSIHSFAPYEMCQYMSRMQDRIGSISISERHFQMLFQMIRPFFHPLAHQFCLSPNVLLFGPRRSGKRLLLSMVAKELGVNLIEVNCYNLIQPTESQTATHLQKFISVSASTYPVIVHLRRFSAFWEQSLAHGRADCSFFSSVLQQELISSAKISNVVIIASCEGPNATVPVGIASLFCYELSFDSLQSVERSQLMQHYLPPQFHRLVQEACASIAGASGGDILDLCSLVELNYYSRCYDVSHPDDERLQLFGARDESSPEPRPDSSDFSAAIAAYQKRIASAEGAAISSSGIPNVKWEDIGGLADVKQAILDVIELPYRHPELFQTGIRRKSGLLLYGPPGTGKTLFAKAIATECSLNFISIKGPELLNMYVGESEANVRAVFERGRSSKPCILFFDELDSLAPNRGQGSDSGGVMDRVVSQLLTELDGMDKANDVFVIGATNRPDLIDTALLRPGRLDTCMYLGTCQDRGSQVKVLEALTRKFKLAEDVCLEAIANSCPYTFTGADFYALCSDAMLNAIKSYIKTVDDYFRQDSDERVQGNFKARLKSISPGQFQIRVSQDNFVKAHGVLTPSLTESDLHHYEMLRKQFEDSRNS